MGDRTRTNGCFHAGFLRTFFQNIFDTHQSQLLAVALCPLGRVLPAALDEVDCFWTFDLVDDFGLNAGACDHRCTDCAANHQYFVKLNHLASIGCQLFDAQNITGLYSILLAAGFHYRKHLRFLCFFAPFGPHSGVLAKATSDSASEFTDVLHLDAAQVAPHCALIHGFGFEVKPLHSSCVGVNFTISTAIRSKRSAIMVK